MVRQFFRLVFVALISLSLYLSLSPGAGSVPMLWNDKLIHCVSYFVLMMTLDFAWRSGRLLIVKSSFVLIYSCLIEVGQSFVPGREMSIGDVIANGCGVLLFLLMVPMLKQYGIYQQLKLT